MRLPGACHHLKQGFWHTGPKLPIFRDIAKLFRIVQYVAVPTLLFYPFIRSIMFKRFLLLSAITVTALAGTNTALAADRHVKVINKTKTPIMAFYASRTSSDDWEEDILGDDVIMPGESMVINIDDGTGACRFDFKGEFEDGEEVVKSNVDVCKVGEFSFTQ